MFACSAVPVAPPPGVMRLNAFPASWVLATENQSRDPSASACTNHTHAKLADRAQRRREQEQRLHLSEPVVRGEDLGDARREEVDADGAEREERDAPDGPVRMLVPVDVEMEVAVTRLVGVVVGLGAVLGVKHPRPPPTPPPRLPRSGSGAPRS